MSAERRGQGLLGGEGRVPSYLDEAARRDRRPKRSEAELAESEHRYRLLFETSPDAMLLIVPDGPIIRANEAACRLFGMSEEELIARGRQGIVDADDPRLRRAVEERARSGSYNGLLRYLRKDGSSFEGEVSSTLFRGLDGALLASLVVRDVSARLALERELTEERDFAKRVLGLMGQGLSVTNAEDRFIFVNEALCRLLGRKEEELVGLRPRDITEKSELEGLEAQMILRERGRMDAYQSSLLRADGSPVPVLVTAVPRGGSGDYRGAIAVVTDLSDLRRTQEELEESLSQNRRLLVELQHRVKNSFNLVLSLAGMAAAEHAEARAPLEDLEQRIRAVAQLHSFLYASGSVEAVALDAYCGTILQTLRSLSGRVRIEDRLEALSLPAGMAAPLGLVLTELLTNALKHAWPEGAAGKVEVSLARGPRGGRLEVRDDGRGLPAGLEAGQRPGSGLGLARGMASQIGGSLDISSAEPGVLCRLDFPLDRRRLPRS